MNKLLKKFASRTNVTDIPPFAVQGGLAATPSEMYRNSQMGIPISSQLISESNFDDGEVSAITDVPFLFKRGVDVGDVIAYEESCRDKVSSAYKKLQSNSSNE